MHDAQLTTGLFLSKIKSFARNSSPIYALITALITSKIFQTMIVRVISRIVIHELSPLSYR